LDVGDIAFDLIFPREYLRGALIVSLLSIWVLVVLFYYLNRYTKRNYFTIWTAAWLFYALWLTLGITAPSSSPDSWLHIIRQWCVGISAIFLLWGSLHFLEIKARQSLFGLFMGFLLTWSYVAPSVVADPLLIQLPIFSLIGLSSMFAGVSFYRLRKRRQFVGVGMLFLGFFLWGVYLATYPFSQRFDALSNVGFLVSAVLQLFIAVSMIVLVLEEARYTNEQMRQQIQSVKTEKEALQMKMLVVEEQNKSVFSQSGLRMDLQKAYEELRQTQHSVVQQERLRALGQMASGIAHDINNALSPILAFSELILAKAENLDGLSQKNLNHIRTSAEDIAQIVARMSEFYRRREDNEQLKGVDLNRLAQQVVDLTSPRWRDIPQGQGILVQVQTEFQNGLPALYANESEIREALTNILLNAVDALPQGGLIQITTRGLHMAPENSDDNKPDRIMLEVRDNGIGMDEKTRQRCLEPFFSTKRSRGGAGLGLAMVYGTVERHDGSIQIESEPGKGTTIRLIFPVRQAPAASHPDSSAAPKVTKPLHILCIDDEPLLRELLKELLEYSRHLVETADGGQAGLDRFEAARAQGKPFDVVITDLGMPYVDGRQVAERIKGNSPDTPVILLTGWGAMLDEKEGVMAHVNAVLSKPPRVTELNETVARVVAQVA
jgi:signal transduction histidine kinase/ActR/RegA family two-component response regulator